MSNSRQVTPVAAKSTGARAIVLRTASLATWDSVSSVARLAPVSKGLKAYSTSDPATESIASVRPSSLRARALRAMGEAGISPTEECASDAVAALLGLLGAAISTICVPAAEECVSVGALLGLLGAAASSIGIAAAEECVSVGALLGLFG